MAAHSRDCQMPSGAVPPVFPPHPPLQSGGWYRSLVRREVLGPGRYPVDLPPRGSMAAALVLTAILGPAGLCYVSATTGLVATALAATILVVSGAGVAPLLVIWPLSMLWAAIGTSSWGRHGGR